MTFDEKIAELDRKIKKRIEELTGLIEISEGLTERYRLELAGLKKLLEQDPKPKKPTFPPNTIY